MNMKLIECPNEIPKYDGIDFDHENNLGKELVNKYVTRVEHHVKEFNQDRMENMENEGFTLNGKGDFISYEFIKPVAVC